MSEIFAEMIFIFGDVHCDPHEVRQVLPVHMPCALSSTALAPVYKKS